MILNLLGINKEALSVALKSAFTDVDVEVGVTDVLPGLGKMKDAKKHLGDLKALQKTMKSMELSKLDVLDDGTLNSDALARYVNQLQGLNEVEAKAVLSASTLDATQQKQVLSTYNLTLAKAALENSEQSITEEQKEQIIQSGLLTAEQLDQAVATGVLTVAENGNIVATEGLTRAQIEEQLVAAGVAPQSAAIIAAMVGETSAKTANAGATSLLTKAILALNAAFMSNPVGFVVTAVVALTAAIASAVVVTNQLSKTTEKYREKLKEIKTELSDVESQFEPLQTELESVKQRMAELKGLGTLSFTEQEEYDNLKKQNAELERQIKLLEYQQKVKNREANEAFVKTMESDVTNKDEYSKKPTGDVVKGSSIFANIGRALSGNLTHTAAVSYTATDENEYLQDELVAYEKAYQKIEELTTEAASASGERKQQIEQEIKQQEDKIKQIDTYFNSKMTQWEKDAEGISYIKNPDSEDDKKVNAWLDYINDFQDRVMIASGSENAKINAFKRVIDNVAFDATVQGLEDKGKEGLVTAEMLDGSQYQPFINKLVEIGVIDSADNLQAIADAFNSLSKKADDASNSIQRTKTNLDRLSDVEKLSKGFDQLSAIYKDVKDGGEFDFSSILNNDEFKETFKEYEDDYTNFVETIAKSPKDIEACQQSFNKLATAYLYDKTALRGVTSETKDATVAMLEQMGIANALEIVGDQVIINEEALAIAKEKNIVASGKLTDATIDELTVLAQEGTVSEVTANYLDYLLLSKIDLNKYKLNTTDDVNKILAIANAAGVSAEQVVALQKVLAIVGQFGDNFKPVDISGLDEETLSRAPREWVENQFAYANAMKEAQAIIDNAAQSKFDASDFYAQFQSQFDSSDSKETFDWIETYIERIQRKITNAGKIIGATYRSWAERVTGVKDANRELNNELQAQSDAATKYQNLANGVGLSQHYIDKIKNGAIDIDTLDDENLIEKIQKYQEYYEKYLAAKDREEDIRAELASNYQEEFNLISEEYEAKIGRIEHEKSMIDSMISQAEASGYLVSRAYYDAMLKAEYSNQTELINERNKLQDYLNKAVANGDIKTGTKDWYDMQSSIDEVNQAIQDSNASIIEFENNIRDIKWELFDKEREYVENIRDEISFFIDLMSSDKLFDKKGNMTDLGEATAGLHAVSYNTYLADAEEYADEIVEINKELAEDQYNQDLLERREELLELQRESILAAQEEKEAMKDLISDGYDVFLDYLQEVIDKRKEAMDEISDLQDYEKSIAEQTKTIADYKKQLGAYAGDDSEESRAKVQQLQVSLKEAEDALAESEYEQWKKDQEQMLDSLYDETQEWINERLDHIDELVEGVINKTNDKADEIKSTLTQEAGNVGYTISTSLSDIWSTDGSGKNVVAMNIANAATTVNTTLLTISSFIEGMAEHMGVKAKTQVNENQKQMNASSNGGTTQPAPTTGNNNEQKSSVTWGSWFIEKAFNGSDKSLNIDTSIVDRLKWKDKDSSFSARAQYYSAMGGQGTYTGSASQNVWMLNEMKKNKFSKGGTIGSLIKKTGEDGFVLARTGEEVLSLEKIREIHDAFEAMNPVVSSLKQISVPTLRSNGNYNANTMRDINVSFTLPGVHNYEELVSKMQSDTRFGKIIEQMTFGKALGNNSLSKYKY